MRTPEQIEEILDKVESLLGEFSTAEDNHNRNEWSKKYGERLGKYSDKLKALNGDDFDVVSSSYDEYHNDYSDLTDDDYMDALEENIKKVVQRVWPDATPEQAEQIAEEAVAETEGENKGETEVTITAEAEPKEEEPKEEEKTTSDEDCKEEEKKEESTTDKALDVTEDATKATPTPVDDAAVKAVKVTKDALEETPEIEEGSNDDLEAFTKELEEYKKRG